jgi:hypothetical protein
MIKMLLFTAPLLAPILAYGQNPSADLSVQVTPPGSDPPNSITCAIGPNYTGSIPAGAQAAGFTTCAANYDFTQTGSFTDSLGTHTWSTLSSWFQCPDAGTFGAIIYNNQANPATQPCSDTSIVTDNNGDAGATGKQALQILWTLSDYNAGTQITQLNSVSGQGKPTPPGTTFPTGMYVEVVDRITAATYSGVQNGGAGWTPYFSDVFWGGDYGSVNCRTEFDFIERYYPNNVTGGNVIGSCGAPNPSAEPGATSGYSNTVYSNAGTRITVDTSGNMAVCRYLNNVQLSPKGCATATLTGGGSSGTITQRNNLLLWSGPNRPAGSTTCGGSCTPNVTNTELIQRITFWTCASWQTTACTGTVDSGTP